MSTTLLQRKDRLEQVVGALGFRDGNLTRVDSKQKLAISFAAPIDGLSKVSADGQVDRTESTSSSTNNDINHLRSSTLTYKQENTNDASKRLVATPAPGAKSIRIRPMNKSKSQLSTYVDTITSSAEKLENRSALLLNSRQNTQLSIQVNLKNAPSLSDINFKSVLSQQGSFKGSLGFNKEAINGSSNNGGNSNSHAKNGLAASEDTDSSQTQPTQSQMRRSRYLMGANMQNSTTQTIKNLSIDSKIIDSFAIPVGQMFSSIQDIRTSTSIVQQNTEKRVRWMDDGDTWSKSAVYGTVNSSARTAKQLKQDQLQQQYQLKSSKGILRKQSYGSETPKAISTSFILSSPKPNAKIFKQLSGITCQRLPVKRISMARKNAILAQINSKI